MMKNYRVSSRNSRIKVTVERSDECLMGEWVDVFFVIKSIGKTILSVDKHYDGYKARRCANQIVYAAK